MAFSKNVRKSVVDASIANDYVSSITCSQSKALDRLQPQLTKQSKLHTIISLEFIANRKATAKDSSVSKDLKIDNESSLTKTFSINSSPVIRNLRNEVLLTHLVSSFSPSYLEVMEKKMAEMEQRVILLTKALKDKDVKIATLMNKLEVQDSGESSLDPKHPPAFTLKGENARVDKGKRGEGASQHRHSTSMASIFVQQLQDMITNTIRAQYGGSSTSSLIHSKPYTKCIDNMRMPNGYQPPKFLQFDRKGNPKQHIAHFTETCESARTQGSLLVKQFVCSSEMRLIGTLIWNLNQSIIRNNSKGSFSIDFIAHVA